jgi:hypothetical protein
MCSSVILNVSLHEIRISLRIYWPVFHRQILSPHLPWKYVWSGLKMYRHSFKFLVKQLICSCFDILILDFTFRRSRYLHAHFWVLLSWFLLEHWLFWEDIFLKWSFQLAMEFRKTLLFYHIYMLGRRCLVFQLQLPRFNIVYIRFAR